MPCRLTHRFIVYSGLHRLAAFACVSYVPTERGAGWAVALLAVVRNRPTCRPCLVVALERIYNFAAVVAKIVAPVFSYCLAYHFCPLWVSMVAVAVTISFNAARGSAP